MIQFLQVEIFLLEAAIRGFIIVLVGLFLYQFQKKSERRENSRDMARILRNEINQTLNIIPNRERERTITNENGILPNSNVYLGLLQTGNIRFFNDKLQDNLAKWYSIIDDYLFDDNKENFGIEIIQDLEIMEYKNMAYRDKWRFKKGPEN